MNITVEQLWNDHSSKLLAFIKSRVDDNQAAEDIRQNVFLKVNTRLNSVKEVGKVQGWIYQIARNAIIDHSRSRRTTVRLTDTLIAEEVDRRDNVRQEIQQWIVPMIRTLPEKYRDTLLLTDVRRVSQKRVAAMQGLSVPGIKARIQRGRRMLKEKLLACCQFVKDHEGTVIDYEGKGDTCEQC